MAQIKDLIVTGAARIIGNLYARNIFGNLSGNATTATSATKDAGGNTITNTYIKNLSFADNKLTYTRGDNTSNYIEFSPTGVVTATDSTAGIMKLYGTTGNNTDGTMSQSAITSSLSSLLNDATLTGDCTAPTPDLDDYSNAIATTAFVRDYIEQYVEDALSLTLPAEEEEEEEPVSPGGGEEEPPGEGDPETDSQEQEPNNQEELNP